MRKLFFTLLLLLSVSPFLLAQKKSLQFCYITKDYNIKVNPLMNELTDIFDFVCEDENFAAIFYLADLAEPIIVKVNLPGDNRKEMDKIYEALVSKSETPVNPFLDLQTIPALFEQNPLMDAGGNAFSEVEFRFYISPSFWDLNYNEQVISSLWYVMEFDQTWADGYVSMSIFHQKGDNLKTNTAAPFGPMDLCASKKFQLLTY